ncbi:carnitine 3-dehydrogenase [Coralliovum pocilloporae]|uniref:carnitine 3-dehydrogenase n=1 Tax=Coralliovum pocilloporae TaxID=3066369 RepID=UPI0033078650
MMELRKAACIGGGVIGGGWIARLVLNGIDVAVFDPDPEAERKVSEVLANAEHAYAKMTMAPPVPKGTITYAKTLEEAVRDADFIQESAPERVDLKQKIHAEIDQYARPDALIGSSTSGILPTDIQKDMQRPERLFVAHPFNPVYLLPLVEVVGGEKTSQDAIDRAMGMFQSIGMKPLHVKKEIEAFIADRFLEAVWREGLWLINDGIATTQEIDDAIRYGFGLRWAQMGLFETYRVAGGEAGMKHFIAQFGPCLKWPWTKLMDVPELTDELVDKIASQSDEQSGMYSIRELERIRDDNLVAIMQALRGNRWGAGQVLADYEERLYERAHGVAAETAEEADYSKPLKVVETSVQPEWVDYNNHMTESRYLQVFGDMSDAFYKVLGIDQAYHDAGGSYYTVETHIMHILEVAGMEPIYGTTQLVDADDKRLHLFHRLYHGRTNELLASAEQMMLHVNTKESRASVAEPHILEKVYAIKAAHDSLEKPEAAGRSIGIKRKG